MLQGPNKFKNHKIRWLFRPLILAKFESLWIQVYSLVAAWGFWTVFSLSFFSLFEFSQGFLKDLFPLIHCYWMPFTVGCPSFDSVILGFLGYHGFPLFVRLDTRTNVVSVTLVTGPFLILHYFPLLRFLLQKPLVDFPVLRGPRELDLWSFFFQGF